MVVRNLKIGGKWQTRETAGGLPLEANKEFKISIKAASDNYVVKVNDKEFCTYTDYVEKKSMDHIYIKGDIELYKVEIIPGKAELSCSDQIKNAKDTLADDMKKQCEDEKAKALAALKKDLEDKHASEVADLKADLEQAKKEASDKAKAALAALKEELEKAKAAVKQQISESLGTCAKV